MCHLSQHDKVQMILNYLPFSLGTDDLSLTVHPTFSSQFLGILLLMNFLHTCSDKKTLKKWFFIDKTVG